MESLIHSATLKPSLHKFMFPKTAVSLCSPAGATPFNIHRIRKTTTTITTICGLKSSRRSSQITSATNRNKILLSEESPPPLSEEGLDGDGEAPGEGKKSANKHGVLRAAKRLPRKILSLLSNLPLAMGELFFGAALMALGLSFILSLNISIWVLEVLS